MIPSEIKSQLIDYIQGRFDELPCITSISDNGVLEFEDDDFDMPFGLERLVDAEIDKYVKQYEKALK